VQLPDLPENILGDIELDDGKILAVQHEGDRLTIVVETWLAGSPLIQNANGSYTPDLTPMTLRFFGARQLRLTMNAEPEVRREVPVSELPEELRGAVADRATVSKILDASVAVTLAEFLAAARDAIWCAGNDGPGRFRIELHGPRRPRLIVDYERAQVEVATTSQ